MHILGSIDCASRFTPEGDQMFYHIILSEVEAILSPVMTRTRGEAANGKKSTTLAGGVVTWSSSTLEKESQIKICEEISDRGRKIEKDVENYMDTNPPGLLVVRYGKISRVELSKGTMFGLPYVRFVQGNTELKFNLVKNIFEKAGKLDDELFKSYYKTLKDAFGSKLKVKV